MLVGEPPFVADNAMEIVAKHLIEQPRHPNTLVRGIPIALDELVVAMLDKDPKNRPALARVCEVLERCSHGDVVRFEQSGIAGERPPDAERLGGRERGIEPRHRPYHSAVGQRPVDERRTQRRTTCWVPALQQCSEIGAIDLAVESEPCCLPARPRATLVAGVLGEVAGVVRRRCRR